MHSSCTRTCSHMAGKDPATLSAGLLEGGPRAHGIHESEVSFFSARVYSHCRVSVHTIKAQRFDSFGG